MWPRDATWMRCGALARLCGLPTRTVRLWCAQGRIPASRRGGAFWHVNLRELKRKRESGAIDLYFEALERGFGMGALTQTRQTRQAVAVYPLEGSRRAPR